MAGLRVASVEEPFRSPRAVLSAVEALRLLEAMGLLDEDEVIDRLDRGTLNRIVEAAAAGGMTPDAVVPLVARWESDPEQIGDALDALRNALEESPVPVAEWRSLTRLFGADRLAELIGISRVSLRRYASAQRPTPDDIAARLHFLAKLVGHLRGAYNDIGVRRWFDRARTQLGGRAPREILQGKWDPDASGPMEVRQLARSLTASAAT